MTIHDKVNQWRGIKAPSTQPKVADATTNAVPSKGDAPTKDTTGDIVGDPATPNVVTKPSIPTTPKVVVTTKGKNTK